MNRSVIRNAIVKTDKAGMSGLEIVRDGFVCPENDSRTIDDDNLVGESIKCLFPFFTRVMLFEESLVVSDVTARRFLPYWTTSMVAYFESV